MKCILWTTEGGFLLRPYRILQYSITYCYFIPTQLHTSLYIQGTSQFTLCAMRPHDKKELYVDSHISACCHGYKLTHTLTEMENGVCF